MQFLIIGIDGTDEKAQERRMAARPAHVKLGDELTASGNMWYGAALLNDNGTMKGSMLLMDFPSREKMQEWLDKEPYVTEGVWKNYYVHPCNVREPWQFNRPKEFFESREKHL
ncbi:MAG: YciI family protein [Patescibacteria group bacterium]